MTRFARADGSKSCNKRTPEEPTPWAELKPQPSNDEKPGKFHKEGDDNKNIKRNKKKKTELTESKVATGSTDMKTEENSSVLGSNSDVDALQFPILSMKSKQNVNICKSRKGKPKEKLQTIKALESSVNINIKPSKLEELKKRKPDFKLAEDGRRVKKFRNGTERVWFDLPYEEGSRMGYFEGFWVKSEALDDLKKLRDELQEEENDKKLVMKKMMKAKRAAHRQLRMELIYEQRDALRAAGQYVEPTKAKQKKKKGKVDSMKPKSDQCQEGKLASSSKTKQTEGVTAKDSETVEVAESAQEIDSSAPISKVTNKQSRAKSKNKTDMLVPKCQVLVHDEEQTVSKNRKVEKATSEQFKNKTSLVSDLPLDRESDNVNTNSNAVVTETGKDINEKGNYDTSLSGSSVIYEENDIMTCFQDYWVRKSSIETLKKSEIEKRKEIIKGRGTSNLSEDLARDEQVTLQRAMKRLKRFEHKLLNQKLQKMNILKTTTGRGKTDKRKSTKILAASKFNVKSFPRTAEGCKSKLNMVMFDGFPVTKETSERLTALKERLVSNNATEEEISNVLKRERRKEERALKRERQMFCYGCRESGHQVSDCPKLAGSGSAIGICFKCGSTEHQLSACSVKKGGSKLSHAVCFICNQQGHISRECPDNPRGLYPRGGACALCSSVNHLARDCPKAKEEEEAPVQTADVMKGEELEDLEDVGTASISENKRVRSSKSKNKIIKF